MHAYEYIDSLTYNYACVSYPLGKSSATVQKKKNK